MGIVAEFGIPPYAVPGGTTLEAMSEATIQIERIVPTNEAAMPYFWMFGAETEPFRDHILTEPEIKSITVLTEVNYGALFEATWTPDAEVIAGIKQLRATILDASGSADGWSFQVRAPDRDRLNEFRRLFTEQDIPVHVERVYNFAEIIEDDHPITPEQRETLVTAYRRGYFDKPRTISQDELGDQFGITGRAVSDRLRRGTRNLVAGTLLEPQQRWC